MLGDVHLFKECWAFKITIDFFLFAFEEGNNPDKES